MPPCLYAIVVIQTPIPRPRIVIPAPIAAPAQRESIAFVLSTSSFVLFIVIPAQAGIQTTSHTIRNTYAAIPYVGRDASHLEDYCAPQPRICSASFSTSS